jgi:hypothetical protein
VVDYLENPQSFKLMSEEFDTFSDEEAQRIILNRRGGFQRHEPSRWSVGGYLASLAFLFLLFLGLQSCREHTSENSDSDLGNPSTEGSKVHREISDHAKILGSLIDHQKLDSLKSKRAATPRLRKASYWLEVARREGFDPKEVLDQANIINAPKNKHRVEVQTASLIRNNIILQRLGCLDEEGMAKLRKGNAPTIRKGPYSGEIASADHIIPRSVCPELDNKLYNLEFMPLTLNQRKSAKVTSRQVALAKEWNLKRLLSDAGLEAVEDEVN